MSTEVLEVLNVETPNLQNKILLPNGMCFQRSFYFADLTLKPGERNVIIL
jgi:hypothetical protein